MLLVHGLGGSSFTWRHLIPELRRSHRVFAVDLKGFGSSPKPYGEDYSLAEQARLLRRGIQRYDLRKLTIIGHSMGGGVALMTTQQLIMEGDPRVSALVLIDSVGYRQKLPNVFHVLRTPVVGLAALHLIPARMQIEHSLRSSYHRPKTITEDQVLGWMEPFDDPGAKYAMYRTVQQIVPEDIDRITAQYRHMYVPTLIVWGRQDPVVPLEIGERLYRDLLSSKLLIINECGHLPHEERPRMTVPSIVEFVRHQSELTSRLSLSGS